MRVYFETEIMGKEVTITARASDVNEYSEALNLRVSVVLPDDSLIPLHKYTDDFDDIERIEQAALDELYANKYEGELTLD